MNMREVSEKLKLSAVGNHDDPVSDIHSLFTKGRVG